jgi:hypothetical protein
LGVELFHADGRTDRKLTAEFHSCFANVLKIYAYLKVIHGAFLSFARAPQLYRVEALHPPAHPVTVVVLRETTKGTL